MKGDSNRDITLIRALKKGKSEAYSFLMHTYYYQLWVYATKLSKNQDLSKDIVQNVFVNVWINRKKLNDDFVVQSYLYRSVYNQFIDHYRKRKSVINLTKKHLNKIENSIENGYAPPEKLIQILRQEIEKLPPKCKQTFLLSKKEGLSNLEIATYLNLSIKSVEAHITKAFNLLRKSMCANK